MFEIGIIFFAFYLNSYIHCEECVQPTKTAGLTIAIGTINNFPPTTYNNFPVDGCECETGLLRHFWRSVKYSVPTHAMRIYPYDYYPYNNDAAIVVSTYYECSNLCICDEDGMCYEKEKQAEYAIVGFVPYCTGDECHMYLALRDDTILVNEDGKKFTGSNPDMNGVEMAPDSKYIRAKSLSCAGCDIIKSHDLNKCTKKIEPCILPPNTASMAISSWTTNGHPESTFDYIGLCQCDNELRYIWEAVQTNILQQLYSQKQLAFVLDSNACNKNECHMYGIMKIDTDEHGFNGPLILDDGRKLKYNKTSYLTPLGKSSPHIKTKAISCYGCDEIYFGDQCYNPIKFFNNYTTQTSVGFTSTSATPTETATCMETAASMETTTSTETTAISILTTVIIDDNALVAKSINATDRLWTLFREWCQEFYPSGITPDSKQPCIDSILASSTSVGLTIAHSSLNSFPDITSIPIAALKCTYSGKSSTHFTRYLFNPSTETYPNKVDISRSGAFTLDSDFLCPNFCACTEAGKCYNQSSTGAHVYVKFIPYCVDIFMYAEFKRDSPTPDYGVQPPCYMYMVVYDQGLDGTPLMDSSGKLFQTSPDPNKVEIGINSFYVRVNSVSCSGCELLQNVKCYAEEKECTNTPGTAGLTIATGTNSSSLLHITEPVEKCHCSNGVRHFWPSTSINLPERVYDARKNSLIINTFYKQTCPNLCICDANKICYVPSRAYAYVEFFAYCQDYLCQMYAIPYDDSLYGPLMYQNGSSFKSFGRPLDTVSIYSSYIKADSISCNGCDELIPQGKCYGSTNSGQSENRTVQSIDLQFIEILPPKANRIGFDQMPKAEAYTSILTACKYAYDQYTYEDSTWFKNIIQCVQLVAEKYHIPIDAYQKFFMFYIGTSSIFMSNFVFTSLVCICGLGLTLVNILKIKFKISAMKPFNFFCNGISIFDLVFFFNILLLEGLHNIMHIFGNWEYGKNGFALNFVRTTFHIQQCAISVSNVLYVLQSLDRCLTVNFPEHYKKRINNKKLLKYNIFIVTLIVVAQFFVYMATPDSCQVSLFSSGQYLIENNCVKMRDIAIHLTDIALFILMIFFNMGTYYKLYKLSYKNVFGTKDFTNDQIILEKSHVIQNLIKIIISFIFILLYIFISLQCDQNQLGCMEATGFVAWMILFCNSSAYRCLWRCFDELIIFIWLSNKNTIIIMNFINSIGNSNQIFSVAAQSSNKQLKEIKIEQELSHQDRENLLRIRFAQLKTDNRSPIPRQASVGSNMSMPINAPKIVPQIFVTNHG